LAYFIDNGLFLSTRRYLRDREYTSIAAALDEQLRAEEESLLVVKRSVSHLEEEMFKRLWRMGRRQETL
jgi:F-type H+-transporting ATPase subunit epsilon